MPMRQLISIHATDSGPYCWKCTQCDQLFWTSNDPSHRHPPARVWAHFQQHSCETFTVIARWLMDAVNPVKCGRETGLENGSSDSAMTRAGKLAKWFMRSLSTPSGIPAGQSILAPAAREAAEESMKRKAAAGRT